MNRLFIIWAATLLVFAPFVSCQPLFQRQVSASVLALEGSAALVRGQQHLPLASGDEVAPGDRIVTEVGSRLDLMVLPGILVELAGETEIEITRLRLVRDGNETIHAMRAREASLRLLRGTLVAAIGQSQTRSRLFAQTAAGDLTAFALRTCQIEVEGNRARVMSVRGKVDFQPNGKGIGVKIPSGYLAEFPQPPGVLKAAAASDSAIQAEVSGILQVEKRLFLLQKALQVSFLPWRKSPG